ncbi:cell division protein FtsQ/DivIB [uncultured Litoreibacter sp.]|uniref:cell division protein FtsQ/DivIB n=1 Tax=uncultured Litoreibacter sp. TaxID=1392394 RepID=UPI00261AB9CD|nr:cell division protein FtsQ/DivIB [uncultured Litoreibacter sp.]
MRSLRGQKKISLKRDPAPSRWAYRMERLWLTPNFRRAVRVGAPLALVIASGVWYFGNEARQQAIVEWVAEARASIEERPEFMVKVMAIDGASDTLAGHIREVMPVSLPISSFDLDLEAMRKQVESLDAVKRVDVRVRSGGLLAVNVVERVPAVIWRGPDGLELLDEGGHRVAAIGSRLERSDLPLIAGEGANVSVPEALALIETAAPLKSRVVGLVRMSELRWDVVMDRGQRIMLPQNGAGPALDRVIALNEAQDLLARDIARVDVRNGQRPILRLTEGALDELRALKSIEIKGTTE